MEVLSETPTASLCDDFFYSKTYSCVWLLPVITIKSSKNSIEYKYIVLKYSIFDAWLWFYNGLLLAHI